MKILFTLLLTIAGFGVIQAQQLNPSNEKSAIKFTIKNFGISTGGSFTGLEGDIEFDKANPEKAVFTITVEAAKVNTGNDSRDNHLRKEEYFDAAKYPKIHFKSDKVTSKGGELTISGQLTIKGTTKNISFPFKATAKDDGYLFEGSFELNRRDYKVGGHSMVLGDNVAVSLSVFASKK